uniref:FZ domain-containing protein n=1 Tax=Athene cunicularia TaxID=194338 RepID=A0A663NAH3_ATHCN
LGVYKPQGFQCAPALGGIVTTGFDIGLSTKCVVIPKEMDMCHKIGYSEMRLPNLMGHTSMAEVILKSTTWQHLTHTDCHPHVRTFLCSLFAPICLDTFIHPCRSMCVAVRESCAPVLTCHGHPWPDSLDCDRFPADEDMCLASLTKEYKYLDKGSWIVLEVFCDSNFGKSLLIWLLLKRLTSLLLKCFKNRIRISDSFCLNFKGLRV